MVVHIQSHAVPSQTCAAIYIKDTCNVTLELDQNKTISEGLEASETRIWCRRQNVPLFFCSLSSWLQLLSVKLQLLLLLQDRFPSKALEGEPAPSSWGISWISPPKLSTSTVLLSDSLRPPACSSIRAPVGEETAGGLAGGTAGGDGARTSAGPSPTAGDSGVVGGVLRTELVPLLGCSCSLSSAISSSRAGSTQGSSGAVTAGGGEFAASVSESETAPLGSSWAIELGYWTTRPFGLWYGSQATFLQSLWIFWLFSPGSPKIPNALFYSSPSLRCISLKGSPWFWDFLLVLPWFVVLLEDLLRLQSCYTIERLYPPPGLVLRTSWANYLAANRILCCF